MTAPCPAPKTSRLQELPTAVDLSHAVNSPWKQQRSILFTTGQYSALLFLANTKPQADKAK